VSKMTTLSAVTLAAAERVAETLAAFLAIASSVALADLGDFDMEQFLKWPDTAERRPMAASKA
jgi:hypothetical protein